MYVQRRAWGQKCQQAVQERGWRDCILERGLCEPPESGLRGRKQDNAKNPIEQTVRCRWLCLPGNGRQWHGFVQEIPSAFYRGHNCDRCGLLLLLLERMEGQRSFHAQATLSTQTQVVMSESATPFTIFGLDAPGMRVGRAISQQNGWPDALATALPRRDGWLERGVTEDAENRRFTICYPSVHPTSVKDFEAAMIGICSMAKLALQLERCERRPSPILCSSHPLSSSTLSVWPRKSWWCTTFPTSDGTGSEYPGRGNFSHQHSGHVWKRLRIDSASEQNLCGVEKPSGLRDRNRRLSQRLRAPKSRTDSAGFRKHCQFSSDLFCIQADPALLEKYRRWDAGPLFDCVGLDQNSQGVLIPNPANSAVS